MNTPQSGQKGQPSQGISLSSPKRKSIGREYNRECPDCPDRPDQGQTFTVKLRALPGWQPDPITRLKQCLKRLLRSAGMACESVRPGVCYCPICTGKEANEG